MSLITEEAYVTEVYQNILFRSANNIASSATQNEVNSWANLISTGQLTEAQVAINVASSVEAANNVLPVISLYSELLNRVPEGGAIAFYVNMITSGVSLNTIAQDFISSPEFSSIYGAHPTANSLVNALYENLLGRAPTASDSTFYNALLGGAANTPTVAQMAAVVLDFTTSPEAVANSTANFENWLVAGVNGTYPTTIGSGPVAYTLTKGVSTSATEGSTVTFHLATANLAAGTIVPYTLSGVTATEILGSQLSGTVTVAADGTANIPVTLSNTAGQGLTGSLTATLGVPGNPSSVTSASIPLVETAVGVPVYSLTGSIVGGGTFATEGASLNFHVSTSNVAVGSTLSYTLAGVTTSEVVGGLLTGTTVIALDGTANIPVVLTSAANQGLSGQLTVSLVVPAKIAATSVTNASVFLFESVTAITTTPPATGTGTTTVTTPVTVPATVNSFQQLTSTSGGNDIVGGSGNDIFLASYSDGGVNTFNSGDIIQGSNSGTNTLIIIPAAATPNAATTLNDNLWTHVTGVENIVVTTGLGAQTIMTGASFQAAFATSGVNLAMTSGAGAIDVVMTTAPLTGPAAAVTFTGAATINTTTNGGAQTIYAGSGATTVVATAQAAGAIVIGGADLVSVTASSAGAGAQTITDTGNAVVAVTATTTGSGSQTIITGNGNSTVVDTTSSVLGLVNITVGNGANTINVSGSNVAAVEHVTVGSGSNGILLTALHTGLDTVTVGANGGSTTALTAVTNLVQTDTITFSDVVASATVLNLLGNSYTSVAAGETAALAVGQHGIAEFNFNGNEYVFQHGGTSNLTVGATDTLLALVGVTNIDLTGHYSLGVITHI